MLTLVSRKVNRFQEHWQFSFQHVIFLVSMPIFTSNHTPLKYKRMHVLICCFLNQTPIFDSWYNEMKEQTSKDTCVKKIGQILQI
jgi:hypothetical protein